MTFVMPFDWGADDDRLLAIQLGAALVGWLVAVGLWILAQVADPRRVVPTSTWLALLAYIWSLAAISGSSFPWRATCLIGPAALTIALLVAEVRRYRRPPAGPTAVEGV